MRCTVEPVAPRGRGVSQKSVDDDQAKTDQEDGASGVVVGDDKSSTEGAIVNEDESSIKVGDNVLDAKTDDLVGQIPWVQRLLEIFL